MGLCLPQARLSPSCRSGGPRAVLVRTGAAGRHCAGRRDYHETIQSLDEVLGLESALEQAMPAAPAGDMAQLTVVPQVSFTLACRWPLSHLISRRCTIPLLKFSHNCTAHSICLSPSFLPPNPSVLNSQAAAAAAITMELQTSALLAAEQSARHEKLRRRQAQLRERQQDLEQAASRHSKAAYWHQQRASQLQRRLGQLAAEQMQVGRGAFQSLQGCAN